MRIAYNTEACYGCGVCAMACSYHFYKAFSPELASIKVFTSMRDNKIEWTIDSECDSCKGEDKPLCVEYCLYGALKALKGGN